MRVLSVIGSLSLGGAETYLSRIVRDISAYGVYMEVCALERAGPRLAELEAAGVRVHGTPYLERTQRSNSLTLLRTIRRIREIVRAGRFDIVHTYLFWSDVLGALGAKLAGCPRIIVSRRAMHRWAHSPRAFYHGLEQMANLQATDLIANSRAVLLDAEASEQCLPAARTVIYNGVDVDTYTPTRRRLDRPLRLVTIGALAPRKGQQFAIEAMRLLRTSGVEASLTLVGSGPDEKALREQVAAAGLDDIVKFEGEQLDPRPYLACADVFLLPSRQEGFSNAVLEAMASGLPVVATDVGGNAEAIVDGEGGRIVPPENSEALAAAIAETSRSRTRLGEMGDYNRRRAIEHFSLKASMRRLADWYLSRRMGRTL